MIPGNSELIARAVYTICSGVALRPTKRGLLKATYSSSKLPSKKRARVTYEAHPQPIARTHRPETRRGTSAPSRKPAHLANATRVVARAAEHGVGSTGARALRRHSEHSMNAAIRVRVTLSRTRSPRSSPGVVHFRYRGSLPPPRSRRHPRASRCRAGESVPAGRAAGPL